MPLKKSRSNDFLSSSALDYYNRFAKNRGIERYFRSSRSTRASSDTSLNEKNDTESQNISSEFAKSLTSLGIVNAQHSNLSSSEEQNIKVLAKTSPKKDQTEVKESFSMTEHQGEKNLNLNLLSRIEITLPTPPIQIPSSECPASKENITVYPQALPQLYVPPRILYCAETQTTYPAETEVIDEPIRPILKKLDDSKQDDLQTSPNESVTSKEHRLEWDSLADVGYRPLLICDQSALSSTERKAIKTYMIKQGLTSTENILIFKNSPAKSDEVVKIEKTQPRRRSLTYNDNWMEVYTKYKDKYSTNVPKAFIPDAQSTPLESQQRRFIEKSAQTSVQNLQSKSVQAEIMSQSKTDSYKTSNPDLSENSRDLQVKNVCDDTNSVETGSFMFIADAQKEIQNPIPEPEHQLSTKSSDKLPSKSINAQEETEPSSSTDDNCDSVHDELKMAIALMNSVLDSKTMPTEMKKSLINKLMQKISGLQFVKQELNSEVEKRRSESSTTACSSSTKYGKVKSSTSEKSDRISLVNETEANSDNINPTIDKSALVHDFVKQTLKPMTHSEIDYENHKTSSHMSFSGSGNEASKESSSTLSGNQDSTRMKVHQLIKIEREIERLAKIKQLVQLDLKKNKSSNVKIYENVNSVRNKMETQRSRLSTPPLDEKLSSDLMQRKDNFIENYENQRGKLYEVVLPSESNYTKPYGTKVSTGTNVKSDNYNSRSRQASSVTSCGVTQKLDVVPKKHSNAVETQTTDSLKRITPYFENKNVENARKTQLIDKTKINKQIQTTVEPAKAYSIIFDRNDKKMLLAEKEDRLAAEDKQPIIGLTLKDYLQEKRPNILKTMDQRNECIKELRRLRQLRNEQRKKLLLLTSETSLREKIRKLPPPPLAQKRLFSTRALKLHSLKQYQNLPEVQKKKEIEMINNLKRKNRFILDLFNKNLQQKVLQGKTDISYNYNLFTNGV